MSFLEILLDKSVSEKMRMGALMNRMLIKNGVLIPMDGHSRVVEGRSILIEGDRISAIEDGQELHRVNEIDSMIDASGKAVLPGIVNAHTHVAPTPILRGLTEDRTDGFYGVAMPMENHITPEDVYKMSLLGCIEVMKLGATCINEIWLHMDETAKAIEKTGLRAVIAHKIKEVDLSKIQYGRYERNPNEGQERLEANIKLVEKWHGKVGGRITCRFGTHATDTCSPDLLKKAKRLAKDYGIGLHIHVAQSKEEVQQVRKAYNKGAVEFLNDLGFLGPEVLAVHLVYITSEEVKILKGSSKNQRKLLSTFYQSESR